MNPGCLSLLDPQLWPHITVSARSWGLPHHEAHGLVSFVSRLSDPLSVLSDIYLLFVYLCVCIYVYTLCHVDYGGQASGLTSSAVTHFLILPAHLAFCLLFYGAGDQPQGPRHARQASVLPLSLIPSLFFCFVLLWMGGDGLAVCF